MDKDTVQHIIQVLRKGTLTWHVRSLVLNRHRRKKAMGFYKDPKRCKEIKYKWEYPCESCREYFNSPDLLEVDHNIEIGPFTGNWHNYILKMYCDEKNLQALCFVCHQRKTTKFNASLRFKRERPMVEEEFIIEEDLL